MPPPVLYTNAAITNSIENIFMITSRLLTMYLSFFG